MAYSSGTGYDNNEELESSLDRSLHDLSIKILDRHIKKNSENNNNDNPSPLSNI
jgi:hypothetical protein